MAQTLFNQQNIPGVCQSFYALIITVYGIILAFRRIFHGKTFENIPSFEVDHTKLIPGLYVSRIDKVGKEVITTYDIRLVRPNQGLEFSTGAMHALEHLRAYYLRNQPDVKEKSFISVRWVAVPVLFGDGRLL